MVKIYGSVTSPFVRHCRVACIQEDIPFELVIADYTASAENSPTKKVPYFEDANVNLTDSSSILYYIREKAGKKFLNSAEEAEIFFLADTAIDTAVNLFLMGKDGVTDTPYIDRQKLRFDSCLESLDQHCTPWNGEWHDGYIRVACLLEWGHFRKRFDFSQYKHLSNLFSKMGDEKFFQETKPE